MPDNFTVRRYRPGPAENTAANEALRCGRAIFSVRHRSTIAHVTVVGEIDAVNGRQLGSYVERHIGLATQLILDLRRVEFFGSQGFTALCYVNAHCRNNDVHWRIATSPCVQRILSICDAGGELPLVSPVRRVTTEARGEFAGALT
jgi:anti-anti-sigma factor